MIDLACDQGHTESLDRLKNQLRAELYSGDLGQVNGEEFVGTPDRPYHWDPIVV